MAGITALAPDMDRESAAVVLLPRSMAEASLNTVRDGLKTGVYTGLSVFTDSLAHFRAI